MQICERERRCNVMEDMKIVTHGGKEYALMRLRSVAEVMGLIPPGSGATFMMFPVVGYEEAPDGNMVPLLGAGIIGN